MAARPPGCRVSSRPLCVTAVALGNQKFVYVAMSGTLNCEPAHSYTSNSAAAIFDNNFTYITVPHGGC